MKKQVIKEQSKGMDDLTKLLCLAYLFTAISTVMTTPQEVFDAVLKALF